MRPTEKTRPFSDSVSSRVARALRKAASKKLSAFTLVELIVVITILAILATIGFLALSGYTQDARDASVKANVRSIYSAIAAESALTGNSPRFYVVHDTGAALSDGALAFVDGSSVTLSGGAYGTAGTNYSAGNPDWTKLKLNPEKFRISGNGLPGGTASIAAFASVFGTAGAAYDAKLVTVGALDAALAQTANGRSRSASFFQVAGVAPETEIASVVGNFPAPTAAQVTSSGATAGLVKAPTGTGALVDGGTSGSTSGWVQTPAVAAFVPWTAYVAGQSFSYALPSGTTVTVTVTDPWVGSVAGTKSLHTPACDTDDIAIWGTSGNPQVWAACNVGATTVMPFADMRYDGTSDYNVSTATTAGGIFQWGNNSDVRGVLNASWVVTGNANDDAWGNTTNTNIARKGPCPDGYHVPNGGRNTTNDANVAGTNEWESASVIAASAGLGTVSCPNTITAQYGRLRCLLRLPRSGSRNASNASWNAQGDTGYYWSSSPTWSFAPFAYFNSAAGNFTNLDNRAYGYSVRCIKN